MFATFTRVAGLLLGCFIIMAAFVFESFSQAFQHIESYPVGDNYFLVGSITAFLAVFLVISLGLRTQILSQKIKEYVFGKPAPYEKNAFFRTLAEKSNDMVHISDSAGRILFVNPRACDLLGYEKEEIIRKPVDCFVHANDRELVQNDVARLAGGKDVPPREIRLLQKNGEQLEVEVKGFFLDAEKGKRYIGAVLRDLSKRKQNTALMKTKDEWEKTFNSINDFVSVHDHDFTIIKANIALCDLFEEKPEEIVGKRCYELFHGMDCPVENCPHTKASTHRQSITEIINDPHIGFPLEVTCSPLYDDEGMFKGSVHIARITDRKSTNCRNGFIPICSSCKKIRNSQKIWILNEEYFSEKYNCDFTHTICDECVRVLYPDYIKY